MKICYLADGKSIHTQRWCKHFASLGHEVHLISFQKAYIEGVKVYFINAGEIAVGGGNWKVLLKTGEIKSILKKLKPNILHSHYATSYGIAGALTGYHPYIITAHGSDILVTPQKSILYRTLIKYALRHADWITVVAEHMKEKTIRLGIKSEKISTVMLGVDLSVFNMHERMLPKEKFTLISTRNLEAIYNLDLLLDAVEMVSTKIPDLEVILVGDGTQRKSLENKVNRLGLQKVVKFLGKVSPSEVASVLRSSHIYISTALSDGNSISLNEAIACGLISIVTDIPANKEWINENVNGYLVPVNSQQVLAEKILYLYQNFEAIQKTTYIYNTEIINKKAIWSKNMRVVEEKYKELSDQHE